VQLDIKIAKTFMFSVNIQRRYWPLGNLL